MAFSYYKQLTTNTGFSGTSHSDFPGVIKLTTDSDLNSHVTNASGFDIAFFTDAALTQQLSHELRTYSGGSLVAWFKIPTFTSGSNIYMAYGDSGITTNQSSNATWNSNYKLVIHGRTTADSTSNAATVTDNSVTEGSTGKVDQSMDFESTTPSYLQIADSAALDIAGAHTISAWVNFESHTGNLGGVYYKATTQQFAGAAQKSMDFGFNAGAFYKNHAKDSSNFQHNQKTIDPTDGTWYYVAGAWDGTTTSNVGEKVYWNGADAGETGGVTGTANAVQTNNADAVIGGKALSGTDFLFDGKIEEFRLSDVDRGVNWITTEYNMMNDNGTFWTVGAEQTVSTGRQAAGARSAAGARTSAGARGSAANRVNV